MLVGEAYNLWKETKRTMEAHEVEITWEGFKMAFLDKYFLENVKHEKEIEFLHLVQGMMTVDQYVAKFEMLSKYSSFLHTNPAKS